IFFRDAPGPLGSVTAGLALGTRLGLASSGRSRPRPSFTRSSLAVVVCSGLMARMPFWPMDSRATIRSLLVTPSSFARSMTFTRAATAPLPPQLEVESLDVLERLAPDGGLSPELTQAPRRALGRSLTLWLRLCLDWLRLRLDRAGIVPALRRGLGLWLDGRMPRDPIFGSRENGGRLLFSEPRYRLEGLEAGAHDAYRREQ